MKKHIYTQFDDELVQLNSDIFAMGELVGKQLIAAVSALTDGNHNLADEVQATEKNINRLEIKVDDECQHILAMRQPAAGDLRFILSISRIAHDLERAGDEANKIAKLAENIHVKYKPFQDDRLKALAFDVNKQLKRALGAFRDEDVDAAVDVIKGDKLVDKYYAEGIKDTIKMMQQNPDHIDIIMDKIWALRSIERVGDHAINIAEQVIYFKSGKDVRHRSVKSMEESLDNL
jgi:phosphate transport system protein